MTDMKLLDDCVASLRAINEETVRAGYPPGDRHQTLANVRAMREALRSVPTSMDECRRIVLDWNASQSVTLTGPDTGDTLAIQRANVRSIP